MSECIRIIHTVPLERRRRVLTTERLLVVCPSDGLGARSLALTLDDLAVRVERVAVNQ